MAIFLSHDSAREFWLGPFSERRAQTDRMKDLPSSTVHRYTVDFDALARQGIHELPVHVTVSSANQRSQHDSVRSHVDGRPFPKGSFEHVKGDVWVASPELTFCQMAAAHTLAETVKLGFELCAKYRINEFLDDPETREPLTTPRALRDFSSRFKNHPGARRAQQAAAYVAEHAESPMEVAVAMLLTLPQMYGGYGLPAACLNPEITVRSRADKRVVHTYRADLAWPDRRVVVEYDSNLHHSGKAEVLSDAKRRNNLQDAGWRVVALTWDQVASPAVLDTAVGQLARALRHRIPSYVPLHMAERRDELRRLVLPPKARS